MLGTELVEKRFMRTVSGVLGPERTLVVLGCGVLDADGPPLVLFT